MQRKQTEVTLSLTSVHAVSGGRLVLVGRDLDGALDRALVDGTLVGRQPNIGETWSIVGHISVHEHFGPQVIASKATPLMPNNGGALLHFLSASKSFPGIGRATARKLSDHFGHRLYEVLVQKDFNALVPLVGVEKAFTLVDGIDLLMVDAEVFSWMDRFNVPPNVAGAAAALWGRESIVRFQQDPYAMLLFEPWNTVDTRALAMGVDNGDPRRLSAAVEEALSIRYRLGHMTCTPGEIRHLVSRLLGASENVTLALAAARETGQIIVLSDGSWQSRACHHMEAEISSRLRFRIAQPPREFDPLELSKLTDRFQRENKFALNDEQVRVVELALKNRVAVVTGSAGTGKTAVIAAIAAIREAMLPGRQPEAVLTAVAGRAALRLKRATSRPASTIARLVRESEKLQRGLETGVLVIDEASMLDTPTAYRLLNNVAPETDLLFVGDDAQLPPVGPGRLFHTLISSPALPSVELKTIHRQADSSPIPSAAGRLRVGKMPRMEEFNPADPNQAGVFFVEAEDAELKSAVVATFCALCGPIPVADEVESLFRKDVQVLTATKNGNSGYSALNTTIDALYMANQKIIDNWGIHVGSKLLWLKNDYSKGYRRGSDGAPILDDETGNPRIDGLMNGSLGRVIHSTDHGIWAKFDDEVEDEIRYDDRSKFTLGWAVSVHKAQGSAFKRVLFPVARSRILDRTLLYTAMTRAEESVVFVGSRETFRKAVEALPRAAGRGTSLNFG